MRVIVGGDCIPCGHGQYRPELADECLDCKLPKLLWAEKCVWWHLPLIPIGAIALLLSLCLILSHVKKRHQKEQARVCADQTAVMESLERELWDEEPGTADTLTKYTTALKAFGMKEDEAGDFGRQGGDFGEILCLLKLFNGDCLAGETPPTH